MRVIQVLLLSLAALFTLNACNFPDTADQKQNKLQEQLTMQAVNSVGMPAVINYERKKTLKNIIELSDKALSTTTYTYDMQGRLHKLCDSIGFPIPAATQYTNPMKYEYHSNGSVVVPQADPDGTYSPASSEATWVMCLNPETKKASALYVEPRVIASEFALKSVD